MVEQCKSIIYIRLIWWLKSDQDPFLTIPTFLQLKMAYIENCDFLLVGILRGEVVQINDKSMEIDNFCTLISKWSGPTLDFAC